MPVNDLADFEVLDPDTPSFQLDPTSTNLTRFNTASWAAAVQKLWLTPTPRIILTEGLGESFTTVCGTSLRLTTTTGARPGPRDVRRECYRFREGHPTTRTLGPEVTPSGWPPMLSVRPPIEPPPRSSACGCPVTPNTVAVPTSTSLSLAAIAALTTVPWGDERGRCLVPAGGGSQP